MLFVHLSKFQINSVDIMNKIIHHCSSSLTGKTSLLTLIYSVTNWTVLFTWYHELAVYKELHCYCCEV